MNRVQKRQLRAYLHFRDRSMSVIALICFNWRIHVIIAAAGASTVGAMLFFGNVFLACIFGAAYGAMMLRGIGHYIRWSCTWPMSRELIDWAKAERLAVETGLIA